MGIGQAVLLIATVTGFYIAGMGSGAMLAQVVSVQHQQQHDPPPANADRAERCRSTCHQQHCDEWRSCNELPEGADRLACHKRTEENEQRCMQNCDVG